MNKTSSKEPLWLKNHWRIFESIRIRSDLQEDIELIRAKQLALPLIADIDFLKLVRKHKVPVTCIGALEHLVVYPDASDEELKTKIDSPIRWVHPSMGKIGPKGTVMSFDIWEHVRGGYFGPSILLEVHPNTKRSEIKQFLDEYSSELDEALKLNPYWTQEDYPIEYAGRIDKPDYIGEEALRLKDKNMESPKILDELDKRSDITESNIRAKISTARSRRNARNKKH
jgi:hypothetical protein